MTSIVVTEIKAAILRRRLLDRLKGRTDIVAPHTLAPGLMRRIPRFLVAGLDDRREPGTGGWPLQTGGRYVKLCFSPALDGLDADDDVEIRHRLPLSRYDYVDYVEAITGLGTNELADVLRIYRFDPEQIFDTCHELRMACPPAWRLLLSNEFALAEGLWPDLGLIPPSSKFRYPLADAFRIVADLERASLIMRHLARARAILDRPRFLSALASPLPLSTWFQPDALIEVYRWIEYATFSSSALTDLLFHRNVAEVTRLPKGYAPWAIARGEMIGHAFDFHDDPEVRKAVIRIFTKPPAVLPQDPKSRKPTAEPLGKQPVERRKVMLRNDEILRWYGMTSEVLPIIALDDVREHCPTRHVGKIPNAMMKKIAENSRPVLARLGSAMRRRGDPVMQHKIETASTRYLKGSRLTGDRSPSLEGNTRLGLRLALIYLPKADQMGGAARFDPTVWRQPHRDADLWRMLLDLRRGGSLHRLKHPRHRQLRIAVGLMRRVYGSFFAGLEWSEEIERAVCDMAFALSPISVDPRIAFAIHTLGLKPTLRQRLSMQLQRGGYRRKHR